MKISEKYLKSSQYSGFNHLKSRAMKNDMIILGKFALSKMENIVLFCIFLVKLIECFEFLIIFLRFFSKSQNFN